MGRPVKKDVNGVEVFGTYASAAGIRVSAYMSGSLRTDVYIDSQVGARQYVCHDASDDVTAKCKLVQGTPSADGEMKMLGYTNPGADISVAIKKLNKRTAIDFNSNRYTWHLENDSSEDYIVLTLADAAD